MGEEKNFEREVLDRLITIELTLKTLTVACPQCQAKIVTHGEDIVALGASTKSAHHRIDSIYKVVGVICTVVGIVFTALNYIFSHGVR